MRRRSHRACHYYVERRRTAGPTSMLCVASPGVAVLLSLSALSLARAPSCSPHRYIGGPPHSLALLSLALSSLSLSLSLAQAAYRRTKCRSMHEAFSRRLPPTHLGGVLMATFTISRAATHEGQEAGRAARRPPSQASSQGRPHPNAEAAPRPLRETRKRSALPPPPALPASQPAPS